MFLTRYNIFLLAPSALIEISRSVKRTLLNFEFPHPPLLWFVKYVSLIAPSRYDEESMLYILARHTQSNIGRS